MNIGDKALVSSFYLFFSLLLLSIRISYNLINGIQFPSSLNPNEQYHYFVMIKKTHCFLNISPLAHCKHCNRHPIVEFRHFRA